METHIYSIVLGTTYDELTQVDNNRDDIPPCVLFAVIWTPIVCLLDACRSLSLKYKVFPSMKSLVIKVH